MGKAFKCLTSWAVHLDLFTGIDSDSFIARHGKPFEILSSEGTNFREREKELKKAFAALENYQQTQLSSQQINRFVFSLPSAPHVGDCWECEIHSHRATLGAQTVTEEVLRTVLVEIEGILNSKPIGYVSSDIADPNSITPTCLLKGRWDSTLPHMVYRDSKLLMET